ncbi:MAG: MFS transporter [Bdellovibrionales bacterium]|nr:MFS transporter [Bdellovibrionales bacterium]
MKDKRLIVIFLTVFIDLVGFGIIIPLNPYLAEKFGASPLMVGLLMSVYSLMQFIFSPIWGQISDRVGRRPVILISLLGGAIAHTAFAFADSLTMLLLARAFAGLFGGNISTAMAYIADITDEKNRSKGMGLVGAAFGLGFILGPVLGGVFGLVGKNLGSEPPLGESFPALIAAGICALNFLFALKFLPESRKFGEQVPVRGHRFARIWQALTTPLLGLLMLMVFLNGCAMALIEAPLFLLVQDKFQWTAWTASFGFGYIGVIMVFTQGFLIRRLLPKYGERHLLTVGLLFMAAGLALVTISDTVALLAVAVTALGLGNGFVNPSLNGSISLASGEEVQGNNLGVSQSLSSLSRIIGPAVGGGLYQHSGMTSPFFAAAALAFAGFVVAWVVRSQLPQSGLKT